MKFIFVTLFKELIEGYFSQSILKRAKENEFISIEYFNPRDFSKDKHLKVDKPMIGGGAGMLMNTQPLDDTLKHIKQNTPNSHVIFLSPVGKKFIQNDAKRLAKKDNIIFVCGRYEGIDERVVEKYADEIFSIGDFILTGGELPALCLCDAISRNIKGVLGNEDSLQIESFESSLLEAPSFAKPNIFEKNSVPLEYLKGNHAKIISLKNRLSQHKTKFFRPDLYKMRNKRKFDEK